MTLPVADEAIVMTADSRYGCIAHVREDDPIGASLQQYGEWAQLEIDFLLRFVAAGDTVVDAGANVGTHTLAFAQAVGAAGRVLSFEPQPTIFELLQRNVAVNGARNVTADRRALGRGHGVRYVPAVDYAARLNTGAVSLLADADDALEPVEMVPLDSLSLGALRLIKIDVEGMEADVIAGARETLDRCRPLLFVECNTIASGTATWEALRGARYVVFFKRSAAFHPNNFRGNPMNRFGAARESNLFCIPQELEDTVLRTLANEPELFRIDAAENLALQLLRTPRYGDAGENGAGAAGEAQLRELRARVAEQCGEIERLNYRNAKQIHQHEQREQRAADELTALRDRLHAAEANAAEANAAASAANAAAAAAEERQRVATEELAARLAAAHAEADAQAAAAEERQRIASEGFAARLAGANAEANAAASAAEARHRVAIEGLTARLADAYAEAHAQSVAFDDAVRRLNDELRAATQRLEGRIAEMADELAAGTQRNELLAAELDGSERRFAQAEVERNAARALLAEATEHRTRLDDECRVRAAALHAQTEECRLTVEQLREEVRSRDMLIRSVLSSRSWRLTTPLRKLKQLMVPAAEHEGV